jgi:hypothetical protein
MATISDMEEGKSKEVKVPRKAYHMSSVEKLI